MVYFCNMNARLNIVILIMFLSLGSLKCFAQQQPQSAAQKSVYLTPMCVYEGDTIPYVKLPTVYIFKPLKFKNKRDMNKYYKLIRDVKKVLPISKEINRAIIETLRIHDDPAHRESPPETHESSREKLEGAIHSPHEETYLCPRQTVNKTGRPTDQLHRI